MFEMHLRYSKKKKHAQVHYDTWNPHKYFLDIQQFSIESQHSYWHDFHFFLTTSNTDLEFSIPEPTSKPCVYVAILKHILICGITKLYTHQVFLKISKSNGANKETTPHPTFSAAHILVWCWIDRCHCQHYTLLQKHTHEMVIIKISSILSSGHMYGFLQSSQNTEQSKEVVNLEMCCLDRESKEMFVGIRHFRGVLRD